jgi:hypothetical protein
MKMRIKFVMLSLLLVLLLLLSACAQKPEVREVVKEKVVEKEVPLNLPDTAERIAAGELDVGTEYGMELGQRYHTIHADTLGLACTTCHLKSYADDYVYQRRYKVPVRGAPGPVDRGVCLGCHKENGPAATSLYGTASD